MLILRKSHAPTIAANPFAFADSISRPPCRENENEYEKENDFENEGGRLYARGADGGDRAGVIPPLA